MSVEACGVSSVMRSDATKKLGFAKAILLFFAILFTAVLIHPDVDLLDVHDVKISSARSQFAPIEGRVVQQAPILFAAAETGLPTILERLLLEVAAGSSRDVGASSILRI